MSDDDHIIDWILKKTEPKKVRNYLTSKRNNRFENRKIKLDVTIFFCKSCNSTWSRVSQHISSSKYVHYPQNLIPTYGKRRRICPNCKKEK